MPDFQTSFNGGFVLKNFPPNIAPRDASLKKIIKFSINYNHAGKLWGQLYLVIQSGFALLNLIWWESVDKKVRAEVLMWE